MTLQGGLAVLSRADAAVFHFINSTLYWPPLANLTFFTANDDFLLGVLCAAALGYCLWAGWRRALQIGLWSLAAIGCSRLLLNEYLKPFFNRPRPFATLANVHLSANLRDLSTVSLSFPSTHSASAAALAVVAAGLDPRLRIPVWLFAFVVGLGAVYSGGHYPLDVLAGYGVGILLGEVLKFIYRRTWPGNRPAEN
jgi:membrane-associated phospholipid phosphatase